MPGPLTSASSRFMVSSGPLPLLIVTNPATVVSLPIYSLLKPHRRHDQGLIRGSRPQSKLAAGQGAGLSFSHERGVNRRQNRSKQHFSGSSQPQHKISEFLMTAPMNGTAAPPYQSPMLGSLAPNPTNSTWG